MVNYPTSRWKSVRPVFMASTPSFGKGTASALRYKMKQAKAKRILPREHTGYSKHSLPTTQEMTLHMDIIRWSIPKSEGLYSFELKME